MTNTYKTPYFEVRGPDAKNPKKINTYHEFLFALKFEDEEKIKKLSSEVDVSKIFVAKDFFCRSLDDFDKVPLFDAAIDHELSKNVLLYLKPKSPSIEQLLKSLMILLEDFCDTEKSFENIFDSILNKITVNELIPVSSLYQPRFFVKNPEAKISLLHLVAKECNSTAIKVLLSKGADPNLKGILNKKTVYPAELVFEHWRRHCVELNRLSCLEMLIDAGADLNLRNGSNISIFSKVIEKSQIPTIRKILAKQTPKSVADWQCLKRKSSPLYTFFTKNKIDLSKHKMLQNIFKHEKRLIWFSGDSSKVNCDRFFQHNSLKEALSRRYGISSSQFTKRFESLLFQRSEAKVNINLGVFAYLDFLSLCFLKRDKPNFSDFIETFLSAPIESIYTFSRNTNANKNKVLFKILSLYNVDFHIKEILSFKNGDFRGTDLKDTIEMFNNHTNHLTEHLKSLDFERKNSLEKIHDEFVLKIECLEQGDFPLKQEENFPELNKLKTIKIGNEFDIEIAQTNYDLIRWGTLMGHCVGNGSYGEDILEKQCIIFALVKDKVPMYCVEVNPEKRDIEQIQGKSKTTPPKEVLVDLISKVKKIGLMKKDYTFEGIK